MQHNKEPLLGFSYVNTCTPKLYIDFSTQILSLLHLANSQSTYFKETNI